MAANLTHFHLLSHPSSSLPKPASLPPTSLFGSQLKTRRPFSTRFVSKFHPRATTATVSFCLPTSRKSEKDTSEKLPKWSSREIKSFAMAELEARKLKYPNTGTEALLMGILVEGESGEVTTTHLLLGIWSEKESAGCNILATLGFDDEKANGLAESKDKDIHWSFK